MLNIYLFLIVTYSCYTYIVLSIGIRLNDSRPVAIKFVDSSNEHAAQREYTIYSNLHAIDNATVERFGIPAVYYYGKWEEFIVMAITLCEGSLNDRENDFAFPLNALIVFQQFVSATVLCFSVCLFY